MIGFQVADLAFAEHGHRQVIEVDEIVAALEQAPATIVVFIVKVRNEFALLVVAADPLLESEIHESPLLDEPFPACVVAIQALR